MIPTIYDFSEKKLKRMKMPARNPGYLIRFDSNEWKSSILMLTLITSHISYYNFVNY